MTVSINCTACSGFVEIADVACQRCGRKLTADERAALKARFAASNLDYRDAKTAVDRSLSISLVAGLLTLAFAFMRLALEFKSDANLTDITSAAGALDEVMIGSALVMLFFIGKRFPVASLSVASALWLAVLVIPFVGAPAATLLALASPSGVVLTLARVGVLFGLLYGIPSALTLKRLRSGMPAQ